MTALLVACGGPTYPDEAEIQARTLAQGDLDGDGLIDAREWQRCTDPGTALAGVDTNRDGAMDASEREREPRGPGRRFDRPRDQAMDPKEAQ